MPEISRFFGLVIKMQYRDHMPPHFHVWYGGRSHATIDIVRAILHRGALPRPQLTAVLAWTYLHQQELLHAWDTACRDRRPPHIRPLG